MNEQERNLVTGIEMTKREDTVHNPITGEYRKVDDSDNRQLTKSDNTAN